MPRPSNLSAPGAIARRIALLALGMLALLMLWIVLAVREALIYLVVALAPMAWATSVWPAVALVRRRTVELLAALVFSKLAIAMALSVGLGALGGIGNRPLLLRGRVQLEPRPAGRAADDVEKPRPHAAIPCSPAQAGIPFGAAAAMAACHSSKTRSATPSQPWRSAQARRAGSMSWA